MEENRTGHLFWWTAHMKWGARGKEGDSHHFFMYLRRQLSMRIHSRLLSSVGSESYLNHSGSHVFFFFVVLLSFSLYLPRYLGLLSWRLGFITCALLIFTLSSPPNVRRPTWHQQKIVLLDTLAARARVAIMLHPQNLRSCLSETFPLGIHYL